MNSRLNTIGRPSPLKAELRGEVSPKRQPQWLSEVVATVIHAVRGQAKAIAIDLPTSEQAVYRVADINDADALRAWWIPTISRVTGSNAILEAIAQQCGCVVFQLPASADPHDGDLVAQIATTVREFGEALSQIAVSMADGTITQSERQRIEREIHDVHAALETVRAFVALRAA